MRHTATQYMSKCTNTRNTELCVLKVLNFNWTAKFRCDFHFVIDYYILVKIAI